MAMRRPRIKPVANISLSSKRKPKQPVEVKSENVSEDLIRKEDSNEQLKEVVPALDNESSNKPDNLLEVGSNLSNGTNSNVNILSKNAAKHEKNEGSVNVPYAKDQVDANAEIKSLIINNLTNDVDSTKTANELISKDTKSNDDSNAFKCPPKVGFQRTVSHTSNSGLDDVFYSDIEENAFQMDFEKSPSSCPLSPSKNMARPRIRPTPHFGQRRNSFVGSSPLSHTSTNEENHSLNNILSNDVVTQTFQTRRERHNSASISNNSHFSNHHTPHKYLPAGITNAVGRVRTESGCSVFSDTNASIHKQRKIEDNKQLVRKDFESRFHKGVPEKSEIKMYDLIFYNPTTNPMEQKSKPNCKLEQNDSSATDVKPSEIKTDKSDDSEAVPVPQLKLNAKGELILDDKSLVIETTAEQEARKVLANSSLIYLDEHTGMNGFYSRKKRTRDWIPSDTIKFYRCLQNIGTDFSLMVSLFPDRTRRDLKLKFKSEERKNNHLINKALLYPKQFDLESLKKQIDEEEKLREEQIAVKQKKNKKPSKKKKINCQSKANRILVNSVYPNENAEQKINTTVDVPQTEKVIETHDNTVEVESNEEISHKDTEKKVKEKKSKKRYKLSEVEKLIKRDFDKDHNRKIENYYAKQRRRRRRYRKKQLALTEKEIKVESKLEPNESEIQETRQLELEMENLLEADTADAQCDNTFGTIISKTSQVDQYNEQIDLTSHDIQHTIPAEENVASNVMETENYEHRTFVNLDDGSLNVYSNMKDGIVFLSPAGISSDPFSSLPPIENNNSSFESASVEPHVAGHETYSTVSSEYELNEADIQSILKELADGSLVLVSSLDPDDPDKVLNEIYMVDKDTGDLCEEPLNIPDNIVQCILTVVS